MVGKKVKIRVDPEVEIRLQWKASHVVLSLFSPHEPASAPPWTRKTFKLVKFPSFPPLAALALWWQPGQPPTQLPLPSLPQLAPVQCQLQATSADMLQYWTRFLAPTGALYAMKYHFPLGLNSTIITCCSVPSSQIPTHACLTCTVG